MVHRAIAPRFPSLVALLLLWPIAAHPQEIGTVALAVANVSSTPPNAAKRKLTQGTAIFLDEVVSTALASRAEFLFLDQTSLSMGENTQIVLDRFVFDPDSGAGEMALSLTKGALRFIGGKVSDSRPALVVTPTATIGIRGSSAIVSTTGTTTQVIFVAGNELCLTPNGAAAPICTSLIGGILNDQGFAGQIDPQNLERLLSAIDDINAAGGSLTDLDGLDLSTYVPNDTLPYTTSGGQSSDAAGDTPVWPFDAPVYPPEDDLPDFCDDFPEECFNDFQRQ